MSNDVPASHEDVEVRPGGNMGGAVRVGTACVAPQVRGTPTVQRFLAHLHANGLDWVPEPMGQDEHGRDRVSYIGGSCRSARCRTGSGMTTC